MTTSVGYRVWDRCAREWVDDIFMLPDGTIKIFSVSEVFGSVELVKTMPADKDDRYLILLSTSMHDRSGTEIYEGDMLSSDTKPSHEGRLHARDNYVVYYELTGPFRASFMARLNGGRGKTHLGEMDLNLYTVIGNIIEGEVNV